MAKTAKIREPFKMKKELRLTPGYVLCAVWAIFTVLLIGWTIAASLVTPREIWGGDLWGAFFARLRSFDLVFENYSLAWGAQNLG